MSNLVGKMRRRIKRIHYNSRLCLKKNEIFLSLLSIILSFVTIIVTVNISRKAEIISKNQVDIERRMANPIINCNINYDDMKEKIESVDINISQNPCDNLNISIIPVYSVRIAKIEETDEEQLYRIGLYEDSLLIPIVKGIKNLTMYNTNIGDICTIDFLQNDENLVKFTERASSIPISLNSSEVLLVEMVYFIEVTYSDVLGENVQKVYFCKPNLIKSFKGSNGVQVYSKNCCYIYLTYEHELYEFYQSFLNSSCATFDRIITTEETFEGEFIEACENAIKNNQFFPIWSY